MSGSPLIQRNMILFFPLNNIAVSVQSGFVQSSLAELSLKNWRYNVFPVWHLMRGISMDIKIKTVLMVKGYYKPSFCFQRSSGQEDF